MLGLAEIYESDDGSTVAFRVDGLQITISHHDDVAAVGGWSRQLGWDGGLGSAPSWGFELAPDEFRAAVDRVADSRVSGWFDAPQWVGYWSFPVRDPMGNTVELSCADEAGWDAA